jgi:hypothetical protein
MMERASRAGLGCDLIHIPCGVGLSSDGPTTPYDMYLLPEIAVDHHGIVTVRHAESS